MVSTRRTALVAALALVIGLTPVHPAAAAIPPAGSYFPARTPMVDIAAAPTGDGFWVVDETGGVFTFGDARYHGSIPQLRNNGHTIPAVDAVALEPTPTGNGYWILDHTGGVFTFGDARYHGSIPQLRNDGRSIGRASVTAIAATTSGDGYWVLDGAGGIFAFGDAPFSGSIPGLRADDPTIGRADARDLVTAAHGRGYRVVDHAGGVFTFGSSGYHGSAPGRQIDFRPTGVATRPQGDGYWLVDETGTVLGFGAAETHGAATIPGSGPLPAFPDPDGGFDLLPIPFDSAPGRWLPCRPIHYVVHLDEGTPPGTLAVIKRSVRKVSEASGLTFVFDGFTDERWSIFRWLRDPERYGDRLSPLLISVERPHEEGLLDEEGTILGVGLPLGGLGKIVFGEVALNLSSLMFEIGDENGRWDTRMLEMVTMHEVGHAIGLAHAPAPDQVMTSGEDADALEDFLRTEWQPGDLRGLRRVGRPAGCDTVPQDPLEVDMAMTLAALAELDPAQREPIIDRIPEALVP